MDGLIIVSNRLPVTVSKDETGLSVKMSSGGLATGLKGPHERMNSLWLGWPGDVAGLSSAQQAELDSKLAGYRTCGVKLTSGDIKRYYEGFSNSVLWPLFHCMIDRVQMDMWKDWRCYLEVNQKFAEAAASRYREGDLLWIHDYQLALVPGLLRQLVPEAAIGFFLHIPFPPSDVFRILPWREEILEGLLGADLLGFHTYSYRREFARAADVTLGARMEGDNLHYAGRRIRLGVFPMGIDTGSFAEMSASQEVIGKVEEIRNETGGRRIILGVDRLDYTKGLPRRMLAVERLLEREPSLRDSFRVIQVVVPSRTKIESFARLRRQIDEIVGRINAAYGTVSAVPIHYLYQGVSPTLLVALYRAADVMVVTPLRDGMNLVAKEFVASRTDGDGVLVLSEFAGAAAELVGSLQVNPYDVDRMATSLQKALTMPEKERRVRMRTLRNRVKSYDSYEWANDFIETLKRCGRGADSPPQHISSRSEIEKITGAIRFSGNKLLLLDYDGTLVPFANAPELAAPDPALLQMLADLASVDGMKVHLISGRLKETLEGWFGSLPLGLHAEHGYWSRLSPEDQWETQIIEDIGWKKPILEILEKYVSQTPGSLIEEKTAALTWHYRMSDPELAERKCVELLRELNRELHATPADVLPGHKVIEIRPKGINKGTVVSRIVAGADSATAILAIGDDRTDEDLFSALPRGSFSIHVGSGASVAQYRLPDQKAVRSLLKSLLA